MLSVLSLSFLLYGVAGYTGEPCPTEFNFVMSPTGGRCFFISPDDDWRPFYDAEVDCRKRGGNLATILNSEEDKFLAARTNNSYWYNIGLYRDNDGHWIWMDGSQSTYRQFFKGINLANPDAEHAVITFEKTWGYVKNTDRGPWICSRTAQIL